MSDTLVLRVRPARDIDCLLFWEWANDPAVRTSAFRTEPIGWETHVAWFSGKLADPRCRMFVLLDACGHPVGQVRFDLDAAADALVDVSVAREFRGLGYGAEALRVACARFFAEMSVERVLAYVKPGNTASLRAFENAGFARSSAGRAPDLGAVCFALHRALPPVPLTPRYVVAATHSWNMQIFEERLSRLPGEWSVVDDPRRLSLEWLRSVSPERLFFLHWSWRVPAEIVREYECIGFHLGDVPYGRGGSPLQNLVARGHGETRLTALRMSEEIDAGPVYAKRDVSLAGSAEEVYMRVSELAAEMVTSLILEGAEPKPQVGVPVVFARRRPEQSEIPALPSLRALYDFLRMLDAEGYPCAFLEHGGFRYEFRRTVLYDGRIEADVRIMAAEKT